MQTEAVFSGPIELKGLHCEAKYLRAAVNGLAFVEAQSFATGGRGPKEAFLPVGAVDTTDPDTGAGKHEPALESLRDSLTQTPFHLETPCGSSAHFKLTRYLLRITIDPRYGDSMERMMYNTVLGAKPLTNSARRFISQAITPTLTEIILMAMDTSFTTSGRAAPARCHRSQRTTVSVRIFAIWT